MNVVLRGSDGVSDGLLLAHEEADRADVAQRTHGRKAQSEILDAGLAGCSLQQVSHCPNRDQRIGVREVQRMKAGLAQQGIGIKPERAGEIDEARKISGAY